jgi:hypothetical protein
MGKKELGKVILDSMNEAIDELCSNKGLNEDEKNALNYVVGNLVSLAYSEVGRDKPRVEKIIEEGVNYVH